jgi:hypothetical protein
MIMGEVTIKKTDDTKKDKPKVAKKVTKKTVTKKVAKVHVPKKKVDAVTEPVKEPVKTAGKIWWTEFGAKLHKNGNSGRNTILRAARAADVSFDQAMKALSGPGSIEEKAISLFKT